MTLIFRSFFSLSTLCGLIIMLTFSGCKVGDEDPAISFRSRNARLQANWKLMGMHNAVEISSLDAAGAPGRTEIISDFDGSDLRVKTFINGTQVSDSAFGFNYQMMIQQDGKVTYENTLIFSGLGSKSTGNDNWYWINSDHKKARVYLGSALQFPATAGIAPLQANATLPISTLLTDFYVDGLRNKELKLSYHKSTAQTTLAGFQQISVSSYFTFQSK